MADNIFDKWDKTIDVEGLKKDYEANQNGDFKEVPYGTYEVKVEKMEVKASKKGNPMMSIWFKVLNGEYKGSIIFYNQVMSTWYGIHNANEMLKALVDGIVEIGEFTTFSAYNNTVLDVHEAIEGKFEYALEYGKNDKGYNTYDITEVFEVEE